MRFLKYGWIVAVLLFTATFLQAQDVLVGSAAQRTKKPKYVRGIHLTCWVAGSNKARAKIDQVLNETEINTVVIAIKEYQGEVYIPGVAAAQKYNTYVKAMPDIQNYLADLKKRGIYTIARIVVFKDKKLPAQRSDWAIKSAGGGLWKDHKGNLWVDPYNKEVWEYNFSIAQQAIDLGFDEIQFDYIRFPSDGKIKDCRYSYAAHSSSSAARNLVAFLDAASARFKPQGVALSIDVFGLTPSVSNDMGIGQKIVEMTSSVDYVSPMVYPSHYAKGEYGIANPNAQPYKTVHKTMYDAVRRMPEMKTRLRPWLQDFSLGVKYGPQQVRAQIQACYDLGIYEWLLWSPTSRYTAKALRSKEGKLPQEAELPSSMVQPLPSTLKKVSAVNVSTVAVQP